MPQRTASGLDLTPRKASKLRYFEFLLELDFNDTIFQQLPNNSLFSSQFIGPLSERQEIWWSLRVGA